jgi:ParB/RepB/Spo0J family partition protein
MRQLSPARRDLTALRKGDNVSTPEIKLIRIQHLHIAPFHHRTRWGDMNSLRDSIADHGIIEPLVVRDRKEGGYEIGCGVRRMKAAMMAELKTLPCIVVELDDEDFIAQQVDENRQREGLHPLDEALYCEELSKRGCNNEQIGKRLGLKKRDVVRRMSLLALGPAARRAFIADKFDEESALSIASVSDPGRQGDILAALDAGALQPEELTAYIRRTFTAQIDDVPWRLTDAEIVVKAGACASCPKRSDVQRDLFPRDTIGIHCLDVDCYGAKMDAAWTKARAREGVTILEQAPESLFVHVQSGGRPTVLRSSGMVDADVECPYLKGHTWREAIGQALKPDAEAPTEYLARDLDGRARHLFREAIVAKIVRRSEAATRQAAADKSDATPAAEPGAAPPASPRAENKLRRALVTRLAQAACLGDADTWPWVAARVIEGSTPRALSAAAELLAEPLKTLDPPPPANADPKTSMIALAASSNRQARRVATSVLIFDEADAVNEINDALRDLAKMVDADLAAFEREIRGPS